MTLLKDTFLIAAPVILESKLYSLGAAAVSLDTSELNNDLKIFTDQDTGWGFLVLPPLAEPSPDGLRRRPCLKKFDPLSTLPSHVDKNYLDFPFFVDSSTIRHLNSDKSKVMFIMRGLSGSGKSTIVDLIKSTFDSSKLVVCSADHFFFAEDGTYQFNEKLLSVAHSECQQKAKQACQANTPVVVIDNTNVRRWEMKSYLDLGNSLGYVTVLVQPKTPWRMSPAELAARNSHGVSLEILQRKVKSFEDVCPSYYGWFCSEDKTTRMLRLSSWLLKECLATFPDFKKDLLTSLGIKGWSVDDETASGILAKYYTRHQRAGPLLHCTAKFCARGKAPGAADYHRRQDVREACGKMFHLEVSGLIFTRRTMGARVRLGPGAETLFCKPEEVEWGSPGKPQTASFSVASKNGRKGKKPLGKDQDAETGGAGGGKKKGSKKAMAKAERRLKKAAKRSGWWDDEEVAAEEEGQDSKEQSELEDSGLLSDELRGGSDNSLNLSSCDSSLTDSVLNDLINKRKPNTVSQGDTSCEEESGDISTRAGIERASESPLNAPGLSELYPDLNFRGFARSAHFTLRTAQGVESREVNFDFLRTCDIEQERTVSGQTPQLIPVSHGRAGYYGDGLCCVYFDKPLKLRTIFSGYY